MFRWALTTCFLAAGLVSAQNATSNETTECAEGLKMFVARGTGEDPGTGETGKLVEAIADKIKDSDIEAIQYPAEFIEVNYFLSVANGTAAVKDKLESYAEACPGHKMAFFGYSQGAQVVSNNLCGQPDVWALVGGSLDGSATPKNLTEDIVAVVLMGDPTHNEDSTYNRGTGKGSAVFYRNPGDNACEKIRDRVVSYCDTGDVFCDVGSEPDEEVHASYVKNHREELVDFVTERFNEGGDDGDGGDDSDSPSASSTPSPAEPGAANGVAPMMGVAIFAPLFAFALM